MAALPEDAPSRKLLAEILARSTERKRKNVMSLWDLLERRYLRSGRAFDITSVGNTWQKIGGLQLQSLRNKGGADFRSLILAFAADVGGISVRARGTKRPTPLEDALEAIPDLETRTLMRIALARDRRNAAENERLRGILRNMKSVADCDLPPTQPAVTGSPESGNIESRPKIPPHAKTVLEKFVSDGWIDERRWRIDASGTLFDEFNERLTPVAFVVEVRALLEALG